MSFGNIIGWGFLGFVVYFLLTALAVMIVENRKDDTPLWEVILLCIVFTPVLGIILEMLKPYKPTYQPKEKENK